MDFGSIFGNTASYLFSPTTIAYALAATGLAVHFGYTGLLNFGMAAFMAIGGYGYAISILTFGFPWWAGVLVGVLGGALFALLLGIPTLRLRADYLAIATIAAAEVVRLMFVTELFKDWTNSAGGLSGYHQSFRDANPFPTGTYGFGPWTYNATDLWVRVVGLIALALAVLVVWALMRSPWVACSRASARTRTRCARSARTSSRTRCRRSWSVASSARSAASCSSCRRP